MKYATAGDEHIGKLSVSDWIDQLVERSPSVAKNNLDGRLPDFDRIPGCYLLYFFQKFLQGLS